MKKKNTIIVKDPCTDFFESLPKSPDKVVERQTRIEEFRKAMKDQMKISWELLLKEISV